MDRFCYFVLFSSLTLSVGAYRITVYSVVRSVPSPDHIWSDYTLFSSLLVAIPKLLYYALYSIVVGLHII